MAQVCWGGRRTTRTIGAGTVIRELNQLRPALAWAWRNKWIRDEIKFKMPVAQPAPRDRWLTKEEARTLINTGCAHASHLKLFIRLALATAARKAAILQLTWDRVHFPSDPEPLSWVIDDDLEIEYEKFSATMLIDFGAGAGNKRRAKVPIGDNPGLYRALREAFATRCCDHVIEYREASISDVKTALAAACKRAGITACTVHTLKHTAITWMVQGNLSFTKIAGITGTSAAIIERVYGHHSPEFLAQVGDAVSI